MYSFQSLGTKDIRTLKLKDQKMSFAYLIFHLLQYLAFYLFHVSVIMWLLHCPVRKDLTVKFMMAVSIQLSVKDFFKESYKEIVVTTCPVNMSYVLAVKNLLS
ncbi:hypothetical protein Scep_030633 [Stephania cephalantha]|uniref:Uncharacterized protein n=1 Tax=Stephania cephalantha TaxID=152367 RepID=A0AAP0HGN3_9MAGN